VPAFVAYWGNNGQVRASAFCDVPGLPKPFELVDVLQFRTLNVPYDAVFSGQFSDLGVRSYLFVGHSFDNFAFHQPGWSALWKVNSQSEMFGRECNLLRPVFFVGQKAVVKVSCIDVLEPRAFLKQVAEIDSRNVKPVLFCCFNDCSPQSGESTCLAGGGCPHGIHSNRRCLRCNCWPFDISRFCHRHSSEKRRRRSTAKSDRFRDPALIL